MPSNKPKPIIKKIAHHRNGISCLDFHVAIVQEPDDHGKNREMLVVRFPKSADDEIGNVICAVFDLAQLDKRVIEFGLNSWRGDHYHEIIDEALAKGDSDAK